MSTCFPKWLTVDLGPSNAIGKTTSEADPFFKIYPTRPHAVGRVVCGTQAAEALVLGESTVRWPMFMISLVSHHTSQTLHPNLLDHGANVLSMYGGISTDILVRCSIGYEEKLITGGSSDHFQARWARVG
jgi:hypothetical protein